MADLSQLPAASGKAKLPAAVAIAALLIGTFALIWCAYSTITKGYALHNRGKDGVGTVKSCTRVRQGKNNHTYAHLVEVDGLNTRITQSTPVAAGTQIAVVYLPDNPAVSRFGRAGDPPLPVTDWMLVALCAGLSLLFIWLTTQQTKP